MHVQQLSSRAQSFFKIIEFDEKEELVWEIRKHPFGLFLIYLTGTLVTASIVLVLIVVPMLMSDSAIGANINLNSLKSIMISLGFLLSVLSIVGMIIGAYLYVTNVVLITSEKIAQQLNISLFNRKISQLSIGDIQDVTVTQIGIFARIFNYGTLVIETAGEQQNYTFSYTPTPYEASKAIVGAHEKDVVHHGN